MSGSSLIGITISTRYQVERKLGQGPVGTLYAGVDGPSGQPVAIKILHPDFAPGSPQVEAMLAEAKRASALGHPHLVPLLDSGVHEDRFVYLIEPLLDAPSLADALSEAPMSIPEAMQMGQGVLQALAGLHELDIPHLDLKPSNVFLLPEEGDATRPLLNGVGLHHLLRLEDARKGSRGSCLARPEYLAPEIVKRGGEPGTYSDVYAFGVVMYESLAGRPPFTGSNFASTSKRHVYEKPLSVRLVRPQSAIPEDLDAMVMQCLGKQPKERFETVAAVATAQRRLIEAGVAGEALKLQLSFSGPPPVVTQLDEDPAQTLVGQPSVTEGTTMEEGDAVEAPPPKVDDAETMLDVPALSPAEDEAEASSEDPEAAPAEAGEPGPAEDEPVAEDEPADAPAEADSPEADAPEAQGEPTEGASEAGAPAEDAEAPDSEASEPVQADNGEALSEEPTTVDSAAEASNEAEPEAAADSASLHDADAISPEEGADAETEASSDSAPEASEGAPAGEDAPADGESDSESPAPQAAPSESKSKRSRKKKKKGRNRRAEPQESSPAAAETKPAPEPKPDPEPKQPVVPTAAASLGAETLIEAPAITEPPAEDLGVATPTGENGLHDAGESGVHLDGWFVDGDNVEQLEEQQAKLSVYQVPEEKERSFFLPVLLAVAALVGGVMIYIFSGTPAAPEGPAKAPKKEQITQAKTPAPKTSAPKTPAPTPDAGVPSRASQITSLEQRARAAFDATQWSGAPDALAERLAALKALDPTNKIALRLERQALDRLLAEQSDAFSKGQWDLAESQLSHAAKISPKHPAVAQAMAALKAARAEAAQTTAAQQAEADRLAAEQAAAAQQAAAEQAAAEQAAAEQAAAEQAAAEKAAAEKAEADRLAAEKAAAEKAAAARLASEKAAAAQKAATAKAAAARKAADAKRRREAEAARQKVEAEQRAKAKEAKAKQQKTQAKDLVKAAQVHARNARWSQARKSYQEAIKLDQRNAAAYAGLGKVAFQEQKFSESVKHNERSVQLAPRNAEYRVNLGLAYFKQKKFGQAKSAWEKALSISPNGSAAETATKYLKIVEKRLKN